MKASPTRRRTPRMARASRTRSRSIECCTRSGQWWTPRPERSTTPGSGQLPEIRRCVAVFRAVLVVERQRLRAQTDDAGSCRVIPGMTEPKGIASQESTAGPLSASVPVEPSGLPRPTGAPPCWANPVKPAGAPDLSVPEKWRQTCRRSFGRERPTMSNHDSQTIQPTRPEEARQSRRGGMARGRRMLRGKPKRRRGADMSHVRSPSSLGGRAVIRAPSHSPCAAINNQARVRS